MSTYLEFRDLDKLADDIRENRQRLWHGGAPGLSVDDFILPANETGAPSMGDVSRDLGFSRVVSRLDRAYFTTDRQLGLALASGYGRRTGATGRGTLYAVTLDPEVALEPDDDFPLGPDACFQSPRARIVQVTTQLLDPQDRKLGNYMQRFIDEADRRGSGL